LIQGPKRCGSKSSRAQLSLGLTMWVELSLGLNMGGLNVKAPYVSSGGTRKYYSVCRSNPIHDPFKENIELEQQKFCIKKLSHSFLNVCPL
jgi:hypothetical protein